MTIPPIFMLAQSTVSVYIFSWLAFDLHNIDFLWLKTVYIGKSGKIRKHPQTRMNTGFTGVFLVVRPEGFEPPAFGIGIWFLYQQTLYSSHFYDLWLAFDLHDPLHFLIPRLAKCQIKRRPFSLNTHLTYSYFGAYRDGPGAYRSLVWSWCHCGLIGL